MFSCIRSVCFCYVFSDLATFETQLNILLFFKPLPLRLPPFSFIRPFSLYLVSLSIQGFVAYVMSLISMIYFYYVKLVLESYMKKKRVDDTPFTFIIINFSLIISPLSNRVVVKSSLNLIKCAICNQNEHMQRQEPCRLRPLPSLYWIFVLQVVKNLFLN